MVHGFHPGFVFFGGVHLRSPGEEHPGEAEGENQSDPGMQHARNLWTTERDEEPEEPRRPDAEAGEHQVQIGEAIDPMHQAFVKGIADDVAVREYRIGWRICSIVHRKRSLVVVTGGSATGRSLTGGPATGGVF